MIHKTVTRDNTSLHYAITGKGFPVVLIHGFGEDSSIWNSQVSCLKDHCLLMIPDLPGTGQSLNSGNELTVESMAADIKAMLDQEKTDRCIVFGHSMAGYIALAFAELYPGYLAGFGLVHSTAYADNEEKKKNRQRGIDLIGEYGGYAFLKNSIINLFGNRFKAAQPEVIAALIEKSKLFSNRSLQQYYQAMMLRPDRTDVLRHTSLPVLIIAGTEDIAAPIEDLKVQAGLSERITLQVLDDVGHMGMLEATQPVNQYLLNFIQQHSRVIQP
ncbi:MAG TPA: alpha/beta hydrolase [Sediminibacterium sp.]|nr:alpha/beta hydrolase [Sediminibacterium sp.]